MADQRSTTLKFFSCTGFEDDRMLCSFGFAQVVARRRPLEAVRGCGFSYTGVMEAVIVDCLRTPVGKAPRGTLRNTRPDEMAAIVVRRLLEKYPQVAPAEIEDV